MISSSYCAVSLETSLDRMHSNVICYEPHTLSLIFTAAKLFQSSSDMRNNKTSSFVSLRIHNGGSRDTLNSLHASSCKMFTFCDIMHEAEQKNYVNKLLRVCSTDWKSSL